MVPPTPDHVPPRLPQCPAVITYLVPEPLRALKPSEHRAPALVVMAWPPMRFHRVCGASATCSIRTAPAPRPAAHAVAASGWPWTETTTELASSSTYQPVTDFGTEAVPTS